MRQGTFVSPLQPSLDWLILDSYRLLNLQIAYKIWYEHKITNRNRVMQDSPLLFQTSVVVVERSK